ncbi:MAG: hypothetical protein KF775_06565 [Cyclobacteriaceae bacterium]|nr:hypothetical protein [Cyclobacteriaceae bacterium]
MKSLLSSIRNRQFAFYRHVFIFLWGISISNSILFPAYTLSQQTEEQQIVLQASRLASVSFLGMVMELVLHINSNSSDAYLADTQDDSLDKLDFITTRLFLPHYRVAQQSGRFPLFVINSPDSLPLAISTPPPKA